MRKSCKKQHTKLLVPSPDAKYCEKRDTKACLTCYQDIAGCACCFICVNKCGIKCCQCFCITAGKNTSSNSLESASSGRSGGDQSCGAAKGSSAPEKGSSASESSKHSGESSHAAKTGDQRQKSLKGSTCSHNLDVHNYNKVESAPKQTGSTQRSQHCGLEKPPLPTKTGKHGGHSNDASSKPSTRVKGVGTYSPKTQKSRTKPPTSSPQTTNNANPQGSHSHSSPKASTHRSSSTKTSNFSK